jgi:hypothetical protein
MQYELEAVTCALFGVWDVLCLYGNLSVIFSPHVWVVNKGRQWPGFLSSYVLRFGMAIGRKWSGRNVH